MLGLEKCLIWARFCLSCGQLIRADSNTGVVCRYCFSKLSEDKPNYFDLDEIKTISLFDWTSVNGRFCSAIVRGLKGKKDQRWFMYFAQEIATQIIQTNLAKSKNSFTKYIFIPAPTNNYLGNHALGFANALQTFLGGVVFDGLTKRMNTSQKGQDKEARLTNRIIVKNRLSETKLLAELEERQKTIILVDDVKTTGATLLEMKRCIFDLVGLANGLDIHAAVIFKRQKLRQ